MDDQTSFDFTDIGRLIWKYRKHLLLSAILAGVLGVVISFLLPVYYQSTATIYPAAVTYVESTDLIYRRGNVNELGDTEQAEQILEMFSSQDFKNRIIREAGLFEHYNISPGEQGSWFKIHQKYQELIQAERSRYNAINITVLDKNPVKAAEFVNLIIEELNDFRHEIIGSRLRSHYNTLETARDSLTQVMDQWSDSLFHLQQLGVVSKEERAALLESSGNIRGNADLIQNRIEANLRYGAQYDIVERNVLSIHNQISTMDKIRLQLKTNLSPDTQQQFVFERGHVPDKKATPKRAFVVLGTLGFCLVVVLMYLFFKENRNAILHRLES